MAIDADALHGLAKRFVETICSAKYLVAFTGAGVSVPSGLPDFRSPDGLYAKYGQRVFEIEFFEEEPDAFYNFAREGLVSMCNAEPNVVHTFLASLEERGLLRGVITQNIDGLHQRAGNKNVAEIHGTVRTWRCLKCARRFHFMDQNERNALLRRNFRCECGGLTRPDIVFFGELLPIDEFGKAERWSKMADVFVVLGSSLVVYPAAQLPILALKNGAKLVILNRGPTGLDEYATLKIDSDLVRFVELAVKLLDQHRAHGD